MASEPKSTLLLILAFNTLAIKVGFVFKIWVYDKGDTMP